MEKLTQNTDNLTVLILAAGYGRRMGPFSRMVNKSLVPYDNKPLVSHIIDKFSPNTNFIIACGNLGQQVKDYVSVVHASKHITFIDIPKFDELTTGPATTIRYCSQHLPDAFLWITCDTLFDFDYNGKLDHNWIAVSPVDSAVSQDYCWVERDGEIIVSVHNKEKSTRAVDAFIGLMYVADRTFINTLDTKVAKDVYEGFDNLNLRAHTVRRWQDFGTYEKWQQISTGLPEVSFPKPDELFFRDNRKIIKFTTNPALADMRSERAKLNPACMPGDVISKPNFLFYSEEKGDTLYSCLTPAIFNKFLIWAENNLWIESLPNKNTFHISDNFYRKKTLERLEKFRVKYNTWVEFPTVNNRSVKTIEEYIKDVNFNWLATNVQWVFIHGDMQFDNIIYDKHLDKFTAIDWRTDFAGDMYGDMYYDLAKMLGGLYLSYKYVKEDKFGYEEKNSEAIIDVPSVQHVEEYIDLLHTWVIDRGYDWVKVRTLVPIIYLNMAPLHEAPFDKFLIALAQYTFSQL